MKRILVATDGSDGADRAIDYAARWAKHVSAELLIVNIIGGYGLPNKLMRTFTQAQHCLLYTSDTRDRVADGAATGERA